MNNKRVVITGIGALTPIGNNVESFWENLIKGKSGAAPITKFDATNFKTQFACEITDWNPEDYFDRKALRKYDPYCLYALYVTKQAFSDANIDFDMIDKTMAGVIWATGNGGLSTIENQLIEHVENDFNPRFNPFLSSKMLLDTASGLIAIQHGLMGVNYTTVSACASSNTAIADAYNNIKWNKADLIVCGGSEAPITQTAVGGFNAMKALSKRNEMPTKASRPYDKNRDGFVIAEGAGALILEDYEHALKRGAKIYAEVVGEGNAADAHHITAIHPEGAGPLLGMKKAVKDAGISPGEIDYINAHATSTKLGDIVELKAIEKLMGNDFKNVAISGTKSMTGHLLGAVGAIEAIATILSINNKLIPPTINLESPDPEIPEGANIIKNEAFNKDIKYAMSNTFGFGGHNASVIFKKFEV